MFTRIPKKPSESIFLFGPRGTGKSTWIRENFGQVQTYDLLNTSEALRLARRPDALFHEVQSMAPGTWVVIDEVQKVPALLNEVHRLIETRKLNFVLSGSSARKLRHGGVNLLAGRAVVNYLFPLVSAEMGSDFDVSKALVNGSMPLAVLRDDPVSYLTTYAETYLQEEVKAEALTRNIGGFSRVLEIAARQNGQVTNVSNISREAAVSRQTVQTYFDILVDTLIGYWVQPWQLKRSTKQVSHPKFYLFDCGVARALSGRSPYPPTQEELGPLVETLVLNEIRARLSYAKLRYPFFFWRSYDQVEVDFLCETTGAYVGLEIKAGQGWEARFNRGLTRVRDELGPGKVRCYGVYLGDRLATWGDVQVLPLPDFLRKLWAGEIVG